MRHGSFIQPAYRKPAFVGRSGLLVLLLGAVARGPFCISTLTRISDAILYERGSAMVVPAAHSRLITFESEIRVMASRSCCLDGREDGFDFWGHYTRGGRQFIHLVTVSGPGARHGPASYVQDLTYFTDLYRRLSEVHGCACLGGGHAHHRLGLPGQSSVDIRQVMSICKRNGFQRWCEIITTHETPGMSQSFRRRGRGEVSPGYEIPCIRLNAYSYVDPQCGQLVKTQLQVLPGISPLRLALMHGRDISPEALGEDGIFFPLSHILYDPYEESGHEKRGRQDDADLEMLAEQCRELPEQWQQNIRFEVEDDAISVSLGLSQEHHLSVRYARLPQLTVESVLLTVDGVGVPHDLTPELAGSAADKRLGHICEYAVAWIQRDEAPHEADRDGRGLVVGSQNDAPESDIAHGTHKEANDA